VQELSSEDRERIRLEEVYRHEIRQALARKPSNTSSANLSTFLNSAFGLWVLSAIFLSGLGTAYKSWESQRERERAAETQRQADLRARAVVVERVDREISYRLSQILTALALIDQKWRLSHVFVITPGQGPNPFEDVEDYETLASRPTATASLLKHNPDELEGHMQSLYPEYASYTLLALFAELDRTVPPSERAILDSRRARLLEFSSRRIVFRPNDSKSPAFYLASKLLDEGVLPQWKNPSLRFTTCTPANPFCAPVTNYEVLQTAAPQKGKATASVPK
jgi:hypothetical protein